MQYNEAELAEIDEKVQQMQEDAHQHLTEAYEDFKHRLCMDYLILNMQQQLDGGKFEHIQKVLQMIPGNSSASSIDIKTTMSKLCCCLIFPYIWLQTRTIFEVEANKFAFVVYDDPKEGQKTAIYGPGYHILGYEYKLEGIYSFDQDFPNNIIQSSVGDLKIAKVEQGYIMYLECGGQNIILGPGIHRITEPMVFKNYISLDSYFIHVGPEKWITIPTGYDGISVNRGKIQVLQGGHQHYLPHVSDKFVKMVPRTIQTDKIPTDIPSYVHSLTQSDEAKIRYNQGINKNKKNQSSFNSSTYTQKEQEGDPTLFLLTTTSEGSAVVLDTMMQWKIVDTRLAALTAMEILKVESLGNETTDEQDAISASSKNICNLRKTVLRIAKNHLTAMVGSISLSGKSSLGAQIKQKVPDLLKEKSGMEEIDEENSDEDNQQPLLGKKISGKPGNIKKTKKNLDSTLNSLNSTSSDGQDKGTNFDILSCLQGQTSYLKDIINQDLIKLGCVSDNVCIYRVTPSIEIQKELDKQTKAKVDANTAIIRALSDQKASKINQEIVSKNALVQAESDTNVLMMQAKSEANAKITMANGQAEAIMTVAKARKEEAEELQESKVAKNLALTRVAGEAGEKVFQGQSNSFVFGQNPGDVLFGMMNNLTGQKQIRH